MKRLRFEGAMIIYPNIFALNSGSSYFNKLRISWRIPEERVTNIGSILSYYTSSYNMCPLKKTYEKDKTVCKKR